MDSKTFFQNTARIFTSEYADGNGVLMGEYLITTAHVLDGSSTFEVWIEDKHFTIKTNTAVFFQPPQTNEDGEFLDLAIYKLKDVQSSLKFYEGDVNGEDLTCTAWKHTVNSITKKEDWVPFQTDAMFLERKGNFIECMMSDLLIQGYSGCPLLVKGKLMGILYGSGDEGRTCFFLSGDVIKTVLSGLT